MSIVLYYNQGVSMNNIDVTHWIKSTMLSYGVDAELVNKACEMSEYSGDVSALLDRWMIHLNEPKTQFQIERVLEDIVRIK